MKSIKVRFITLCGLAVLAAAALAPAVSYAACPAIEVQCGDDIDNVLICRGTDDGQGHCTYSDACLNCDPPI
jgi:hypothetical protein